MLSLTGSSPYNVQAGYCTLGDKTKVATLICKGLSNSLWPHGLLNLTLSVWPLSMTLQPYSILKYVGPHKAEESLPTWFNRSSPGIELDVDHS